VAVPKHKKSRARTAHRKAQWKGTPATYSTCPQCHQPKLPHRVCPNCGYYKGRQAVEIE
jgi:large subunit ribosomal protein L32